MAGSASDPFFWNDWQGAPDLRLCSMAAQGMWMRMLCICAESKKKGYLLVNGRAPTLEELSALSSQPVENVRAWIEELGRNGVYSTNRQGIIYCRKMIKGAKKRAASAKGGKIGGRVTRDEQKGIHATRDTTRAVTRHPRRAPLPSPSPNLEGKGSEVSSPPLKDQTLHHDSCTEPQAASVLVEPTVKLPTNRKNEEVGISQAQIVEFRELYPKVEITKELRAMRGWLLANSAKRKTSGGMLRFVNSWLARCQDRGGSGLIPVSGEPLDSHRERMLWLREYARDGRWQANTSGNGIWQDALGVGPPPHDARTLVTAADLAQITGAREKRDSIRAKPPP